MHVNKISRLIISSRRQNIDFIKIYYKKFQTLIFLRNINNSKINHIFKSFWSGFGGKSPE